LPSLATIYHEWQQFKEEKIVPVQQNGSQQVASLKAAEEVKESRSSSEDDSSMYSALRAVKHLNQGSLTY
jgi:hypothetical protein